MTASQTDVYLKSALSPEIHFLSNQTRCNARIGVMLRQRRSGLVSRHSALHRTAVGYGRIAGDARDGRDTAARLTPQTSARSLSVTTWRLPSPSSGKPVATMECRDTVTGLFQCTVSPVAFSRPACSPAKQLRPADRWRSLTCGASECVSWAADSH